MRRETLLPLGILFCMLFVYGNACSCMKQHPQTMFCQSDFVVLARVKRERLLGDARMFKVRVRREYKVTEKGVIALKAGRLRTPKWDSMCGVNMEPGKLYVISGRIENLKAHITQCGSMIQKWEDTTRRQRKGLKMLYRNGCSCDIKYCFRKKCSRSPGSCVTHWKSQCEEREGVCQRQPKGCTWIKTKALAECRRKEWFTNRRLETFN